MNTLFIAAFLFIIALVYRAYGIFVNHPFWVDEYSSANQARIILEQGFNIFRVSDIHVEQHNFIIHTIIAFFFSVFGQEEWVARMPVVIVGSLVPVMVYLLTTKLFDRRTALAAALLTTFSYLEITWSRQARGYIFVQFLTLATVYLYIQLRNGRTYSKKYTVLRLLLLAAIIGVGFFTHALYLIFLAALALDIVIFNFGLIKKSAKNIYAYVFLGLLVVISYSTGHLHTIVDPSFISDLFRVNNVWYYHSFLWREYGLITFLALAGILMCVAERKKQGSVIIIYVVLHLLFINFFFSAYVSRYLLPLLPFLFIAASYAVVRTVDLYLKQQKLDKNRRMRQGIGLALILFIIANGNKFVTKPKHFYSVNHDFREIALIDYHQVYGTIKEKGEIEQGKTAVIDTWHDRLFWYMGRDYKPAYMFRWLNEPGTTSGLLKKTAYTHNNRGEKILPNTNGLRLIGELSDLKKAMVVYSRGFILIDDSSLPKDVREYAEKHFKKELYLDHYPLDDNPYSIWPATLYSWGV